MKLIPCSPPAFCSLSCLPWLICSFLASYCFFCWGALPSFLFLADSPYKAQPPPCASGSKALYFYSVALSPPFGNSIHTSHSSLRVCLLGKLSFRDSSHIIFIQQIFSAFHMPGNGVTVVNKIDTNLFPCGAYILLVEAANK